MSLPPPSDFAGDEGDADPRLLSALAGYDDGTTDLEPVVAALAGARVLVAVVAVLGETGESSLTGLRSDKSADMSLVLLTSPQGRQALPVFTGLESLQRWNPQARPVPVTARRAALSGVDEGCELIVIDPAGPVTAVLNRPATWALAQGRHWRPSWRDPEVSAAIGAALAEVVAVRAVECRQGARAELAVALTLTPGLTRAELDEVTSEVSNRLAHVGLVADRVASLELKLL